MAERRQVRAAAERLDQVAIGRRRSESEPVADARRQRRLRRHRCGGADLRGAAARALGAGVAASIASQFVPITWVDQVQAAWDDLGEVIDTKDLTPVTYIGAVRNAADTWYQGWTCGLQASRPC